MSLGMIHLAGITAFRDSTLQHYPYRASGMRTGLHYNRYHRKECSVLRSEVQILPHLILSSDSTASYSLTAGVFMLISSSVMFVLQRLGILTIMAIWYWFFFLPAILSTACK